MASIEERFGQVQEQGASASENLRLALENERLRQKSTVLAQERDELAGRLHRVKVLVEGAQARIQALEEENARLSRIAEEKERFSRVDALTGLYNRRGYEVLAPTMYETYRSIVRRAHGKEPMRASFNAIYLDLNNFKPINDAISHAAGDQALQRVADALRAGVRDTDKIFRMGGDEFLVLFVGHEEPLGEITAIQDNRFVVAKRIERALKDTGFTFEGADVPALTASIGAAVARPDETLDELKDRADALAGEVKAELKGQGAVGATLIKLDENNGPYVG